MKLYLATGHVLIEARQRNGATVLFTGAAMQELRKGVGEWLEYLRPALAISSRYTWTGPDDKQFWEFIRRAAVLRQFEALETTLKMVDAGHGHFGVMLLRPAYEEFIWIAYLTQHLEIAPELISLLVTHDIAASLSAQNDYVGTKMMSELGLTQRFVKFSEARDRGTQARIREIGRSLKWPQGSHSMLPSVAYLSRQVNREREYKFLYHATSKFVHFSAHELGRRVWGKSGEVTISSKDFSAYWSDFVMYWALWLFIHLIVECSDVLGELNTTPEKDEEMSKWLKTFAAIPIVTIDELRFWGPRLEPKPG